MRVPAALLALLFVAFAGCIEDDEPTNDPATEPSGRPLAGPTAAVFHRANETGAFPVDVALDADLVPVGTTRPIGDSTFEPTIGSDSDGCLYMTSFRGAGTGTRITMSCDQGASWDIIGPDLPGGVGPCFPNSNDPYVHVDRDTDRVYSSDLHALLTSTLHYSDDQGASWTCNALGGGLPPGVHDHQTIATGAPRLLVPVGYENMVYYCVNRVIDSVCASSLDGGLGFGPFILVYPGLESPGEGAPPELCGGLHGHVETDHAGRVYLPKGQCGRVEVAVSGDDGLTWRRSVVSATTGISGHEVRVAADTADNMYAFWIGGSGDGGQGGKPFLSVSRDHGLTWTQPIMVGPPELTTAGLPAVYAGNEGRVAFAYVGITNEGGRDSDPATRTWNGYIGVVYDALSPDPVVATVTANDPADPLHRGQSCWSDRCGGLGDFIDITITPAGRPWAAFSDQCDEACAADPAAGNSGGSRGVVGTFATGRSLTTGESLAPL